MKFDVKTVNELLDIDDSFKAPNKLMKLMLDEEKRTKLFKNFLKIDTDLSYDWFHEYFQDEQAERKAKKQDFTPMSVARLLTGLSISDSNNDGKYYEIAAGTGGLFIAKWHDNFKNDPLTPELKTDNELIQALTSSVFTYDPRRYWYTVEELSDRAIPFLLFNMSIRGVNGVVIQCDVLTREAKRAFFIKNDTSDYLRFSEIIELPKIKEFEEMYQIHWEE